MNSNSGSKQIGIEVKLTDRCNERCFHCVNIDGGEEGSDIDHELFTRRLRELDGGLTGHNWSVTEVRMTGGEPLLNITGVTEIARCCGSLGILCGINTNGSLLTDETAGLLRGQGVRIMKISLDTLDSETLRMMRGARASLGRTLEGLRVAVAAGFEVIARYTLTALNRDELLSCYRYAVDSGASGFQVKPLIETGRGRNCGAGLEPDDLASSLESLARAAGGFSLLPEVLCVPPSEAFGLPGKACGSVNKIYISTDGSVSSCNFIPGGEIGSLCARTLEEILSARVQKTGFSRINGHLVLDGCPRYRGCC